MLFALRHREININSQLENNNKKNIHNTDGVTTKLRGQLLATYTQLITAVVVFY